MVYGVGEGLVLILKMEVQLVIFIEYNGWGELYISVWEGIVIILLFVKQRLLLICLWEWGKRFINEDLSLLLVVFLVCDVFDFNGIYFGFEIGIFYLIFID